MWWVIILGVVLTSLSVIATGVAFINGKIWLAWFNSFFILINLFLTYVNIQSYKKRVQK